MTFVEMIYKGLVRPRVFKMSEQDAELAHEWGIRQLETIQKSMVLSYFFEKLLTYNHPMLETEFCGIKVKRPLGLAAGFDKDCRVHWAGIPAFGWGFCEIGGITHLKQAGNPGPRLMRSETQEAVWNWMGFNNLGAEEASKPLYANSYPTIQHKIPLGLNVGKSKDTPLEKAAEDYCSTIEYLVPYVDFVVVNISSPNTPGLRSLQNRENLEALIEACQKTSVVYKGRLVAPLGIKISPDETDETLADIIDVARKTEVDFIVATNTTTNRNLCPQLPQDRGGISGKPLFERSTKVLEELYKALRGYDIPLIGVGGIFDAKDMYVKILHGASLCELYTAWPFEGPDLAKRILKKLVEYLKSDGFKHISEAVGADV